MLFQEIFIISQFETMQYLTHMNIKRFLFSLPIALGIAFTASSCLVVDGEDYWDDDHHAPHYDAYDYIDYGVWYPEFRSGHTYCEFDSYINFYDEGRVELVDCDGVRYDSGRYHFIGKSNSELVIEYRNGDVEYYYVNRLNWNQLVLESEETGKLYYYVHR